MKMNRTKNAARNMVFGTVLKVYQLAVPFVMRTAMIYFMGVQYLGLNSLFTSVLQVLNLAELGVGSAMVYSMYKPIVNNDEKRICALLHLYRTYYRVIGVVILGIGLGIVPYIPRLIKGDVPADINVYMLYLLNLAATVMSYWLFAYKNSILQAHQRVDVVSKVTLTTDTLKYILQLLAIVVFRNYYYYVLAILGSQILQNIVVAIVSDKMYPRYQPKGMLEHAEIVDIHRRIRDLFTSKIGSIIVNSVDTIVISAFLGLTVLAVYQNYFYLFTAVASLIMIVFQSVSAGVGNSIIVDSKEKVFQDFRKLMFFVAWITGFCCTCFLCLYQPFVELWVGKDYLLDFRIVICLVIYFFVYQMNRLLNSYKDSAGMWHEDRFRPLITAFANLALNLGLVKIIGLYGIILSTVLSTLVVGMPWLICNLFSVIFERKNMRMFLNRLFRYTVTTGFAAAITYTVCTWFEASLAMTVVMRLFICIFVSNFIFTVSYFRLPEFSEWMIFVKKVFSRKDNI